MLNTTDPFDHFCLLLFLSASLFFSAALWSALRSSASSSFFFCLRTCSSSAPPHFSKVWHLVFSSPTGLSVFVHNAAPNLWTCRGSFASICTLKRRILPATSYIRWACMLDGLAPVKMEQEPNHWERESGSAHQSAGTSLEHWRSIGLDGHRLAKNKKKKKTISVVTFN